MKDLDTCIYLRDMLQVVHLHLDFIHIVTSSKPKKQKLFMNLNFWSGVVVVIIIAFQSTFVNTMFGYNQTDP